jgi:pantothenate kinase
LRLTPEDTLAYLRQEAETLLAQPGRHVLGIAGGPGVGKSTIAVQLAQALGPDAAYVPMDGFHMKHAKLESLGTVADKGMPHTFEGAAFADFLERLKAATGDMNGPGYSRKIEDVVDDAFTIPATARLLVVEGNYLLLATAPWWRVKPLLDRAVFIDVPREMVRARLMKRHAEEGLFTEERNRAHIERVDLVNYDTVMRSKPRADIAIEIVTAV